MAPVRRRKPPGRCIFCGKVGLTKEHMWADWLRSYIPRELRARAALSPLGSGYDHIDLTAAAFGADEPLAPIGHGCFGVKEVATGRARSLG